MKLNNNKHAQKPVMEKDFFFNDRYLVSTKKVRGEHHRNLTDIK